MKRTRKNRFYGIAASLCAALLCAAFAPAPALADGEAYREHPDAFENAAVAGLAEAQPGDLVLFGRFEQDNDLTNGGEPIEWIVLDRKGTELLLLSRYELHCMKYNTALQRVTWETCTLRAWLNGPFLERAFGEEEQKILLETKIGEAVTDRVFLLSADEAEKNFSSDAERRCSVTAYAHARGARIEYCFWWLRSAGNSGDLAAFVSGDGIVHSDGIEVNYSACAVRPAVRIDVSGAPAYGEREQGGS